jgi:sugar lactone lactonase YvrE
MIVCLMVSLQSLPRSIRCLLFSLTLTHAAQAQYAVTLAAGSPGNTGLIDGSPAAARFLQPRGIAVHLGSGQVFVVENGHAIRRFTPGVGVETFAGSQIAGSADGVGTAARFSRPEGIAVDSTGTLYVADTLTHLIRRVTSAGIVTTLAGRAGIAGSFDGQGTEAEFNLPRAIAIGPGGTLFVADSGNHVIRRLIIDGGGTVTVTTLAGQPGLPGSRNGTGTGSPTAPQFNSPQGLVVDGDGVVFVADTGNNAIRRISPTGVTTTFAGSVTQSGFTDGKGAKARFNQPFGITLNPADGLMHVTDQGSHSLRRLTRQAEVRSVAGQLGLAGAVNGIGAAVRMQNPRGVGADSAGNLFIADSGNHTLRRAFIPGRLPGISQQPVGLTLVPGKPATFRVTATGPEPMLYQWRRNGIPIAGATLRQFAIPSVSTADQGHYDVVLENPWGVTTSEPVPLVVTGQPSFLWAVRTGSAAEDAALDLAIQSPIAPATAETLWLAGLDGGQLLQQNQVSRGQRLQRQVLDKKGVGLHAIALDANRNSLLGGQSVLVNNGRPAVVLQRSPSGRILWSRSLATERGGRFSPGSNALVHSLAVDGSGSCLAAGYFQGSGKFGNVDLGNSTATTNRAFICKLAANGEVLWAREIFSAPTNGSGLSATEAITWSVVVDDQNAVYAAGVGGPHLRLQIGSANSADSDFAVHTNTFAATPWIAKYSAEGDLLWVHVAAHPGHYFACRLDAEQRPWTTGVDGDRTDALQQQALLQRHDPTDGTPLQSLRLPGGKGASLDISPDFGLAWLVMDPAGQLDYQGRLLGVPGYRCISLDLATLSPRWDHPILGALSLSPLSHSEQVDIRFGNGGRLYLAVNFQAPASPTATVEFCGRIKFPLKNRRSDGFLAALAELPRFDTGPSHTLSALDAPITLSVSPSGFLTPRIQWLRNGRPLLGQTSPTLSLPGRLVDAGSYSVRLSNGIDQITTPAASVGIVDVVGPGIITAAPGGRALLSVRTAGTGLRFAWERAPQGLPVDRSSGVTTANLLLRNLIFPDDAGAYTCTVTGPGGNSLITAPRVLAEP